MVTLISSRASSSEINGIATRALASIKNLKTDDKVIIALSGNMEEANNKLTVAQNRKMGSDATPLEQQLEAKRDKGLKSFFKTVNAATFRLNPEIEKAAKKLNEVIKRHGSTMYDLPQDKQTSAMASLFKELEQPENLAALEVTGTKDLLDEVKVVNQEYLAELAKNSNEDAKKEEPELVTKNVKLVRVNFEKLMNYLDSYLAATENESLKILNAELTESIDKANAIIKARTTRKGNGEKDNGTDTKDNKDDETKKV